MHSAIQFQYYFSSNSPTSQLSFTLLYFIIHIYSFTLILNVQLMSWIRCVLLGRHMLCPISPTYTFSSRVKSHQIWDSSTSSPSHVTRVHNPAYYLGWIVCTMGRRDTKCVELRNTDLKYIVTAFGLSVIFLSTVGLCLNIVIVHFFSLSSLPLTKSPKNFFN